MRLRETFQTLLDQYRIQRIEAARTRLTYLLETTPRYWSAATIGGGARLVLGKVTAEQAVNNVQKLGHDVAHLDVDGAFIALIGDPAMHESAADFDAF